MTRRILMLLLACIPIFAIAQSKGVDKKYMQGAVPIKNGMVEFEKTFYDKGKSKEQIYDLLLAFSKRILKGENQLEQSRITEDDNTQGRICLSMEENLYFKKKKWQTDATRFFYQLIMQANDGSFSITMRRIHYLYEEERTPGGVQFKAEDWITDSATINKKGTGLYKANGKFRRATIDRKTELFKDAAVSVRGLKKVTRQVVVEEYED